ncbi:MAG: hypothetical protein C0503_00180 [Gemmatimonas sp.]|nr:hypothetical protein [Gemmatimonas sp.]
MLTLLLKKHSDGRTAFTLERADGSRTWQRQERHAAFFAAHDLTHYALETITGLRHAFYGLVAQGWDFDDFLPPYPRGPLGAEALWAETLVGLLDVERGTTAPGDTMMSAEEFNAQLSAKLADAGLTAPRALEEVTLRAIRMRRDALIAEWEALPRGETLRLVIDV